MLQDTSLARPQANALRRESLTEAFCAALADYICRFLAFFDLQDFFLAIGPIRSFVTTALASRCQTALTTRLVLPEQNQTSFEDLNYHLDQETKQLLLHAALHALIWRPGMTGVYGGEVAPVGRILLQTGTDSAKMQCAVASALANKLKASFLIVNDELLNLVARSALGSTVLDQTEGGSTGVLRFFLSCFLSGGKLAFVWDLVRRACQHMEPPIVLFIPDVEHTLCGSFLRYDAFVDSFGTLEKPPASTAWPLSGAQPTFSAPVLLVGGCGLGEAGADLLSSTSGRQRGLASNAPPPPPPRNIGPVPGADDSLASLLPQDLVTLPDDRPNPRRKLHKLFATKIKLKVPSSGAAAGRHSQQLLQDSSDSMAEKNASLLQSLVPDRRLPPLTSPIFRQQELTRTQWMLIASWASSMERILAAKGLAGKQQSVPAGEEPLLLENGKAVRETEGTASAADLSAAGRDDANLGGGTTGSAQLCQGEGISSGEAELASCTEPLAGSSGSNTASAKPPLRRDSLTAREQVAAALAPALSAISSAVHAVPKVGLGVLGVQPLLPGGVGATPKNVGDATAPVEPATPPMTPNPSGDTPPEDPRECLNEQALWYGYRMLEKTGGALKAEIKTSNLYEKKLLDEVIRPDAAGGGFDEVGALEKAKDVLRETVQLPLARPDLFTRGSLARPCKGVLLFGPPGTGKTMLARAAAAECGASFLAIQPSTLASKWLGDGVRYVRAAFTLAAKLAPCVLFVDEVDALLSKRNSTQEHEALRELKCEFMQQWDGIRAGGTRPDERVMVLGATNRPQDLDEAALRRFSRRIMVDLPDKAARKAILKVMVENESLADDVDLDKVAAGCEGFSGSDLRQLCTAAAMRPLRDLLAASGKSASTPEREKRKKRKVDAATFEHEHAALQQSGLLLPSSSPAKQPDVPAPAVDTAMVDAPGASTPPQTTEAAPGGSTALQRGVTPAASGSVPEPTVAAPVANAGDVGDGDGSTVTLSGADEGREVAVNGGAHQLLPAQAAFMELLLAECDSMAQSAGQQVPTELRPITAKDFEAARKEVTASSSSDSAVMGELKLWNEQYGEGAKPNNGFNPKLTYFM